MIRAAAALALLSACGVHTTELVDDGGGLPGLVSLEVSPGETTLELTELSAELSATLAATGHFRDGSVRDVTTEVAWSTDRDDAGGFTAPGRWRGSNRAGGVVTAEARSGDVTARAHITIDVRLTVDDPAFPPPPGGRDGFAPGTPVVAGDPMRSPRIVYPAHEVMVPLALEPIVFQHDLGSVADTLRLRFRATHLELDVFTAGDRWRPDAQIWDLLTRTTAGEHAVMTVAGVASSGPTAIYESAPIDLHVAAAAAPGALYYWSSATEAVMKASPSRAAATRFYPGDTCGGCHALSRDGRRMALGLDGEKLHEISVPDRATIIARSRDAGWSTFSPDGRLLLIAHRGELSLLDAASGEPVGGPVLPGTARATHPDWSPLGDQVVVARCMRADDNRNAEGCSIVRVPYTGGGWGEPVVLVAASGPGDNNYFPRFSPDGAWIAYVHAHGRSRDQPTAELRLVPAGGGASFTLARANHRVGPRDDVAGIANTMPAWAPATQRGIDWLAFVSVRDYGKLVVGAKPPQVWIAALDLSRTGDPSFAGLWLPAQDPGERNHLPYWALDPDEPCAGADEVCDGFDNNCDGTIDEGCVD